MSNIFSEAEKGLVAAGKWLIGASTKIASVVAEAKTLAPSTAAAVAKLVTDAEALIALAAPAVGVEGLNFPADSAAYAQFLLVKADLTALVAVIDADVKSL